jgi:FkbM family methyltransferase
MNSTARQVAVRSVEGASTLLGRRRAIRAARFATNVLRYDDGNRIDENGEMLVQRTALSRPDPVIFDVGANVGQWSMALLAQPGHEPTLHAFEPSLYSHTKAVAALGARAEVHALALSSEPGEAELHIVEQGAGVNSLVSTGTAATTEKVSVETVDRFCADHGIDSITLLKVDAEGADLSVLRGAAGMLARRAVGIAQFEYNWRWVFSRTYLRDVFELVDTSPGYALGKVTPKGIEFYPRWHQELETFRESNYVLVRDDWHSEFPTVEWWGG